MTNREQMIECADHIQDGMAELQRLADQRGEWHPSDKLVYWICQAVDLLLRSKVRNDGKNGG